MAASRMDSGTPRIPNTVKRTTGVPPKIIVVMTAAGLPTLKKAITGIMKTNEGMVCIKSMTGRMIAYSLGRRAQKSPSGIPNTIEIQAAVPSKAKVVIAFSQNPNRPM